ncbi:MAG: MaoC family dehydratase N-terminal domain-containing protein [Candidatus Binatia bacterium]|nr:MaoC family dehydratase N-terminal domain-containing protein [Candidatus Binatia bacterium]
MSRLTSEMLSHVGRSRVPVMELATRREIRKYSIATRQKLPKYLEGVEAPPLFYVALFWDVVSLDRMTPDGITVDPLLPELPFPRVMAGGIKTQYSQPIRCGDYLVAKRTLTDLYEKEGKSGPLCFYEVTLDVKTDTGAPVLVEKTTRILR